MPPSSCSSRPGPSRLVSLLAPVLAAASLASSAPPLPAPAAVLAALDAANSFFLADPRNAPNPSTEDCGWTRGTFMSGHMAHYAVTRNATLLAWAERWAEAHNYSCGGVWDDGNFFACGQAYAALYALAPADYKLSLAVTMHRAIANYANSSFFGQDWWWVDLLFMALPSWTRYGVLMGDDEILAQGLREFAATSDGGSNATAQPGLWDAESKLYWRDKTYIAQRAPNGNKVFWARGVGWASAALALTLEYLPPAHAAFPVLLQRLSDIAHALLPLQGADGMWRSSLLDANEYPNPETTGSSCYTFMMATAVKRGWLDAATFTPVIASAWSGLSTLALQPSGLVGFCQPADGQPHPALQNSTSDFCVGQFLLAGSAVYELVAAA